MASRLGLSRIIEWAKGSADIEELDYILIRLGMVRKQRFSAVAAADAHGTKKRTRKGKGRDKREEVLPSAADLDHVEREKAISA